MVVLFLMKSSFSIGIPFNPRTSPLIQDVNTLDIQEKEIDSIKTLFKQYISVGKSHLEKKELKDADRVFDQANELIPDTNFNEKAQFHLDIAYLLQQVGALEKSLYYYQSAINQFDKAKNMLGKAKASQGAATVTGHLGDNAKSIGLMHQAIDIYRGIGNQEGIAQVSMDLGCLFQKWNKNKVASQHFSEAYQYYQEQTNLEKMIEIQIKLGQMAVSDDQYQQALKYFSKVDFMDRGDSLTNNSGLVMLYKGDMYQKMKDYSKAISYFKKSCALYQSEHNQEGHITALQHLGESFLITSDYKRADSVLTSSLNLATIQNLKEYQMTAWRLLSDLNSQIKNYDKAYLFLQNATKIKDEIYSLESTKIINELAIKYETKKINEVNQALAHKNELTNTALKKQKDTGSLTIILATFVVLVAIIIIIFVIVRTRESKKSLALLTIKNKKISDQKEILSILNEKLTQSREQYRSIVENASVGMYQTSREGNIRFANNALRKMLRYPDTLDISSLNLSTDQPSRQLFIDLIEEKSVITGREDIWKRYDGTLLEVNESAWRVIDHSGETHYYEGVVEDISKRKEAELALKESQIKLQQMNEELIEKNQQIEKVKNEAITANEIKSIFLANVSHEIRTPMNSIIGFSEILSQGSNNEQQLHYINAIRSSSSNLLALLNDILDLSKIQSSEIELNYEPISLRRVTNDVLKIFQLKCEEKNLSLNVDYGESLPELINIDGLRMRQILINLLGNAFKFTEEGGIQLKINTTLINKLYCNLSIDIQDTGIGIAEEESETIFEAFKQSKLLGDKAYSGTGLGLSISKQFIDLMGGKISLKSQIGKGTTFTILIPKVEISQKKSNGSRSNYQQFIETNRLQTYHLQKKSNSDPVIPELTDCFKTKLLLSFENEWANLNKSHLIPELNVFAQHLKTFSETENIPWLRTYADELLSACSRFDVDKIEQINKKFRNIFAQQTQN